MSVLVASEMILPTSPVRARSDGNARERPRDARSRPAPGSIPSACIERTCDTVDRSTLAAHLPRNDCHPTGRGSAMDAMSLGYQRASRDRNRTPLDA